MDLVVDIYKLTSNFPTEERYTLVKQMKKSVISIPSNISEGAGRSTAKEYVRFLDIANGSLSELETQLLLSQRLGYLSSPPTIISKLVVIRKMLYKMKQSLNISKQNI